MTVVSDLGGVLIFLGQAMRALLHADAHTRGATAAQVMLVIRRSLSTVIFAALFVGAILVLQFNQILKFYDAQVLLGGLNTSSLIREVGPLLISFILAGKVGAYTAAELGTMRVTEQIDAIECLGKNALETLVVPRLFGIFFASLVLLLVGLVLSVSGAALVAWLICGVAPGGFHLATARFVSFSTFFGGFFKCAFFGLAVGTLSCHRGFFARGGATGVGRAVTGAAVATNLAIVLLDFLTSALLEGGADLFAIVQSLLPGGAP